MRMLTSSYRYSSTNTSAQEQKPNEATSSPNTNAENSAQSEQKPDVDVKQLLEQNAKLNEDINDYKVRITVGSSNLSDHKDQTDGCVI